MAPRFDVRDVFEKAYGVFEAHLEPRVAFARADQRAVRTVQVVINGHLFGIEQVGFDDHAEVEQSARAVGCEARVDHVIAHPYFRLGENIDVALKSRSLRLDLVFERRRDGVCIGYDRHVVFTFGDQLGDVEFGRGFRILVITGQPSVDVEVIGAVHRTDMCEYFAVYPRERHFEFMAVNGRPCTVITLLGRCDAGPERRVGGDLYRIDRGRGGEGFYFPFAAEFLHVGRGTGIAGQCKLFFVVAVQLRSGRFPVDRNLFRVL